MKYDTGSCRILEKQQLTVDIYDVTVDAGKLALLAKPGQFVHVLVPGHTLRRPISICGIDRAANTLRLVFQVRGEGTAQLAALNCGDSIDLLAPLGRGFSLGNTGRKVLFVGGGIGVPPLLEAAKPFGENAAVVLGFRSREAVILKEDFERNGNRVQIATDDGSLGHHGLVTDCMEALEAEHFAFEEVFACGPAPMLKAVSRAAERLGVPCQVSMEQRMACGVGACLGCAVKLRREDGGEYYGHVCKDGPVFRAHDIVWED